MRHLYSAALFPIVACIAPPEAPPDLESIERTCLGCPLVNSPLVNGHPFSWLRLDGVKNDDGVKFLEFRKDDVPRRFDINKNVLGYQDAGGIWRGYKDLEGTVIRIQIASTRYDVKIVRVRNCTSALADPDTQCVDPGIPYWTEVDSGEAETYELYWKKVGQPDTVLQKVCPYVIPEETTGGHRFEALVFEGDRYDPVTREITETDVSQYIAPFNIACMGSLPAKMELSRRTAATSNTTYGDTTYDSTIADDRQALVRAWAAQYCGTKAFTETGHQLRIRDRREWLDHAWGWGPEPFKYEAVWGPEGAVCLDTPRLAVSDPTVPIDPYISKKVQLECGNIPKCTGQSWFPREWKNHGQFLTAVPLQ